MKEFTLKKYSFGDFLGIVGDTGHPVLAEMRKRIDVDEDMPKLITAVGIKPGDIVIDVGGFIGDTAVPMLNAGAHVIVFEPFLDAFTALLYNTRNRGVQAHNTAVGNGEWVKFVYECPGPNYGMRRVKACDPADPEAFPTYRLESLMRPDDKWKVKLIKIDCEGFEIPTLRGAAELIRRDKPFLYIEHYVDGLTQAGLTPEDLVAEIKSHGYDMQMWGAPPRWDWMCWPR